MIPPLAATTAPQPTARAGAGAPADEGRFAGSLTAALTNGTRSAEHHAQTPPSGTPDDAADTEVDDGEPVAEVDDLSAALLVACAQIAVATPVPTPAPGGIDLGPAAGAEVVLDASGTSTALTFAAAAGAPAEGAGEIASPQALADAGAVAAGEVLTGASAPGDASTAADPPAAAVAGAEQSPGASHPIVPMGAIRSDLRDESHPRAPTGPVPPTMPDPGGPRHDSNPPAAEMTDGADPTADTGLHLGDTRHAAPIGPGEPPAPGVGQEAARAARPLLPSTPATASPTPPAHGAGGNAAVLASETVRFLRELGPAPTLQRLAVDLDGTTVAVRLDRSGAVPALRVQVLDDPGGRLDASWSAGVERTLAQSMAHHGTADGQSGRRRDADPQRADDEPDVRATARWSAALTGGTR